MKVAEASSRSQEIGEHLLEPTAGGVRYDEIWRCTRCGEERADTYYYRKFECGEDRANPAGVTASGHFEQSDVYRIIPPEAASELHIDWSKARIQFAGTDE